MGQQFTVTLPDDLADMVRAKVASGEYASVDEVIGEALWRADANEPEAGEDVERWLRTEVVDTIREFRANPSSTMTSDEVAEAIEDSFQQMNSSRRV